MQSFHDVYRRISTSTSPVSDARIAFEGLFRYLLLRARFRNLRVRPFFVHRRSDIKIGPEAHVEFGHSVRFMQDFTGHFYGNVTIGNNVYFNRGCYVSIYERLSVGDNCLFGENVSIHDMNYVLARDRKPIASRGFMTAPIVIGNNVWVGAKVTIVQGVHIGDNAVIGANAVVTHDVPADHIAAGIPARVLREI